MFSSRRRPLEPPRTRRPRPNPFKSLASTCGLHAVNHCLAALGPQKLFTWAAFDALALPGERCPQTGDWEFAALQRNIEAADAGMTPIQGNEHEDLVSWLGDAAEKGHRINPYTSKKLSSQTPDRPPLAAILVSLSPPNF